ELLRQVEAQPFGELDGARDGGAVLREALDDLAGREQDALVVAAPFGLAPVEGAAVADGDQDVLQRRAPGMVRVDVAGDERGDAELLCEPAKCGVASCVAAFVRTLQLDEEAVAPERVREPCGGVGIPDG